MLYSKTTPGTQTLQVKHDPKFSAKKMLQLTGNFHPVCPGSLSKQICTEVHRFTKPFTCTDAPPQASPQLGARSHAPVPAGGHLLAELGPTRHTARPVPTPLFPSQMSHSLAARLEDGRVAPRVLTQPECKPLAPAQVRIQGEEMRVVRKSFPWDAE